MGTAHIIKLFPLKEKTKETQNLHRRKKLQVCTETSISEFAQQNKKNIIQINHVKWKISMKSETHQQMAPMQLNGGSRGSTATRGTQRLRNFIRINRRGRFDG